MDSKHRIIWPVIFATFALLAGYALIANAIIDRDRESVILAMLCFVMSKLYYNDIPEQSNGT